MSEAGPLPKSQRSIMFALAIGVMCERTGSDAETAEDQLDRYAMTISTGEHDAVLRVGNEVLVRAGRQWLRDIDGYRR